MLNHKRELAAERDKAIEAEETAALPAADAK